MKFLPGSVLLVAALTSFGCTSGNNISGSLSSSAGNASTSSNPPSGNPPSGPAPPSTPSVFSSPYSQWSDGPSTSENFFPILVWMQNPSHIQEFKNIGINMFIGYWGNGGDGQMTQIDMSTFANHQMPLIGNQNPVGLSSPQGIWYQAWLQPDEPDNAQPDGSGGYGPCISPSTLISYYNSMKAADTKRPVYMGFGRGVSATNWVGRGSCTGNTAYYAQGAPAADIIGYDIYPINDYNGQLEMIPQGLDNLYQWTNNKKIIWNTIQGGAWQGGSVPTAAQETAMAWMSLIHGSKGLIYFVHEFAPNGTLVREDGIFNFPTVASAVASINAQITSLARVLNSPNVSNMVSNSTNPSATPVDFMVKSYGGSTYIFSAAMRNAATTATFNVAGVNSAVVQVIGENRQINLSGGGFSDSFQPYGVHLYKF